jgi:NADH-quinone oxidoreductase subunit L
MSGLKRVMPMTRWLMLIGCCALAGFPFFSGFFSKDEIVAAAWNTNRVLAIVMLITAFLTAYYTFRLYFRVFEGPEVIPPAPSSHDAESDHAHDHGHDEQHHHSHEPMVMIAPLVLLAIGALIAGYLNWPAEKLGHFLGQSPSFSLSHEVAQRTYALVNAASFGIHEELAKDVQEHEEQMHRWFMIISGLISLAGIGLAYRLHLRDRAAGDALPEKLPEISLILQGKYFIDEVYQAAIVEPLRALGRGFFTIDRIVIDGLIWALSFVPQSAGWVMKLTTQRGFLQGYAVTMVLGIVVVLILMLM